MFIYKSRDGKVRRHKLGRLTSMGLEQARAAVRPLYEKAQAGQDPAADAREAKPSTFAKLGGEYLEKHAKPRKKSWRNDERILEKHLLPFWSTRPVSEITRRDVRERLECIAESAPVQANRVRALCSKLFTFALARDWVTMSPVAGLPAPSVERSRARVLSSDEVGTFWRALEVEQASGRLPSSLANQLRLRLLLGQRGGEVATMLWEDITRTDRTWTQPDPKNGRTHIVPVTEAFDEVLDRQRRRAVPAGCPWVFPNAHLTGPDLHRAWRGVGARAGPKRKQTATGLQAFGIVNAKGHHLRRTCVTHLARLGNPPHLIGRLLNHASALGVVTAIYNRHAYVPELRNALEEWAIEVERLALSVSDDSQVRRFDAATESTA